MARKIGVEVVGDNRSLTRTFRNSARETSKFTREIDRMGRGVAAGSGLFQHFGRSLAFASGGFVAFAGATAFLRDSIDAAREAEVAQASLAAQMKASGESFNQYRGEVLRTAESYGKFGFENDKVIESLTVLERGTGNIRDALKLQGLAADIARAKNIDLAAAANIVAKVFGGQETALRRAVPGLDKNAHGWKLLGEAQAKVAGQARANTTAAERFHAILHDTQEIIGGALLPILNKYLDQLGSWLLKMNESGDLQRDAASAAGFLATALSTAKGIVDAIRFAFDKLNGITGSTKRSLQLLFAVLVGFKTLKLIGTFAEIAANIGLIGTRSRAARTALLRLRTALATLVSAAALGRLGRVAGLLARIAGLAADVGFAFGAMSDQQTGKFRFQFGGKIVTGTGPEDKAPVGATTKIGGVTYKKGRDGIWRPIVGHGTGAGPQRTTGGADLGHLPTSTAATTRRRGRTVQQTLDELGLGVDRAQLTLSLSDDLVALRRLEAYLKERIRVTKKNFALRKQLVGVEKNIVDLQRQQRENAKQSAEDAKQRRQDLAQRAADARASRQFRQLGLGPTGQALVPGVKALQKQLAQARKLIAGTFLDTKKEQSLLGNIAKILSGQLGKVSTAVRQKIAEMLTDIRRQLKSNEASSAGLFRKVTVGQLLSGLGLTADQLRRLSARLAGVGIGGVVPASSSPAFAAQGAQGITVNGDIHFHGVTDIRDFEQQLAKRVRSRAHPRRGAR